MKLALQLKEKVAKKSSMSSKAFQEEVSRQLHEASGGVSAIQGQGRAPATRKSKKMPPTSHASIAARKLPTLLAVRAGRKTEIWLACQPFLGINVPIILAGGVTAPAL